MGEPNLRALAEYVARSLVSDPDKVEVEQVDQDGHTTLKVRVASQDVGRLIGRRGKTIGALRTLVDVGASQLGVTTSVEVVEP